MSMSNLKGQLRNAVYLANSLGQSKRSQKFSADDTFWKIYSRGEMTEMRKIANDLGSFLMEAYPEVKRVIDIRESMLQDWINSKVNTCSQTTLVKYTSALHKLESVCSHAYRGVHMGSDRLYTPLSTKAEAPVRTVSMDEDKYKLLLDKLKNPGLDSRGRQKPQTQVWKSVQLSHAAGLRILETTKILGTSITFTGGRYGYGTVTLSSGGSEGAKHGRGRVIDILNPESQKELQEVVEGVKRGKTVMQKKDGSSYSVDGVYKAIKTAMNEINEEAAEQGKDPVFGKEWNWNRGDHPVRKSFAQKAYNAMRKETKGKMSEKESRKAAIDFTSKELGHGNNRDQDIKTYVSDMW